MLSFNLGSIVDFEARAPDHAEGFVTGFRNRAALVAYECHPRHVALGRPLVAMCEGGVDGIVVRGLKVDA